MIIDLLKEFENVHEDWVQAFAVVMVAAWQKRNLVSRAELLKTDGTIAVVVISNFRSGIDGTDHTGALGKLGGDEIILQQMKKVRHHRFLVTEVDIWLERNHHRFNSLLSPEVYIRCNIRQRLYLRGVEHFFQ